MAKKIILKSLLSDPHGGLLTPEAEKTLIITKVKKIKINCKFCLKIANNRDVTSRNYTLTYSQNLDEIPWLLTLEKILKK